MSICTRSKKQTFADDNCKHFRPGGGATVSDFPKKPLDPDLSNAFILNVKAGLVVYALVKFIEWGTSYGVSMLVVRDIQSTDTLHRLLIKPDLLEDLPYNDEVAKNYSLIDDIALTLPSLPLWVWKEVGNQLDVDRLKPAEIGGSDIMPEEEKQLRERNVRALVAIYQIRLMVLENDMEMAAFKANANAEVNPETQDHQKPEEA